MWLKKLLKKLFSLFLIFSLVCLFTALIFIFSNFFKIQKIIIYTQKTSPPLNLSSLYHQSIIFLNEKNEEKNLIKINPYLKAVSIKKKLPSTLILIPQFYQPVARLKSGDKYIILSDDGRILAKEKNKESSLPSINFYQNFNSYQLSVGDYLDLKEIIFVLKIIPLFLKFQKKINHIDIANTNMIVFNLGKEEVLLSSEKKEEIVEYELREILKKLNDEKRSFKKLDLRFNKPIIVF